MMLEEPIELSQISEASQAVAAFIDSKGMEEASCEGRESAAHAYRRLLTQAEGSSSPATYIGREFGAL